MALLGALIPLAIWTTLGVFLCSKTLTYFKLRQASRSNGCLPPHNYQHKDPFLGLDLFLDQLKAIKRGNTGAIERGRFLAYGKTFESNS